MYFTCRSGTQRGKSAFEALLVLIIVMPTVGHGAKSRSFYFSTLTKGFTGCLLFMPAELPSEHSISSPLTSENTVSFPVK